MKEKWEVYLDMAKGINCPNVLKASRWHIIDASNGENEVWCNLKEKLEEIIWNGNAVLS